MKLYTEEQAKYFFECGRNYQNNAEITFRVARDEIPTKPVELPSDEEINEAGKGHCTFLPSFVYGAQWMRDKIQGQPNPKPIPWIRPKDQMPEDGVPVLITDVEGMQIVAWYSASSDKWRSENHTWFTREIQCWMPIPEIV